MNIFNTKKEIKSYLTAQKQNKQNHWFRPYYGSASQRSFVFDKRSEEKK